MGVTCKLHSFTGSDADISMCEECRDISLHEYDKIEWFDVYRVFFPDATFDDLEAAWASFQQAKTEHEAEKAKGRLS